MPDHIRDVTRISRYFNMQAPGSLVQALLFIALGMFTGVVANMFTHLHSSESLFVSFFSGMSIGIITITVPGILTVAFLKAMRKDMKLKHAFFAVLAISMLYSCALLIGSMFFALLHAYTVTYLILILSNAFIYGYWFLINRVVMDQKRSQIVTAAFQPVLNVLFFIPMGRYLLNASIPLEPSLLKLWSGMLVFMVIGYIILYIMDSPAKKALRISGVDIVTAMVNQWMYDITKDVEVFNGTGVKRDVTTDLIVLRGKKGIKAVFANPDIHYGPFYEIGGGIATEYLGRKIEEATGAAPFIMHGAVSIEDNPVSTRQIYGLSSSIVQQLSSLHPSSFRNASGAVYSGSDKPCRAYCKPSRTGAQAHALLLYAVQQVGEGLRPVGQRVVGDQRCHKEECQQHDGKEACPVHVEHGYEDDSGSHLYGVPEQHVLHVHRPGLLLGYV